MSNDQSSQAPGQNKSYNIVVNGRPRVVTEHKLTYLEVVVLAFPDAIQGGDVLYTVTYANPHGHDGSLAEGQKVTIKDGMVFNVGKTNRS